MNPTKMLNPLHLTGKNLLTGAQPAALHRGQRLGVVAHIPDLIDHRLKPRPTAPKAPELPAGERDLPVIAQHHPAAHQPTPRHIVIPGKQRLPNIIAALHNPHRPIAAQFFLAGTRRLPAARPPTARAAHRPARRPLSPAAGPRRPPVAGISTARLSAAGSATAARPAPRTRLISTRTGLLGPRLPTAARLSAAARPLLGTRTGAARLLLMT